MNLEQQLQILVDQAPKDGVTPNVIAKAVNPVLKSFATQLKHNEYFAYQSVQGNWLLTTLSNRRDPMLEKKVIYAFTTLEDAKLFEQMEGDRPDPDLTAQLIPVTHILFQLFALKKLDSIVFLETAGDLNNGTEVHRRDLQGAIQKKLKQYKQEKSDSTRLA
ncbi:hypothetical protein Lepto7376_3985 [[Leptolyngbya] sp. PCC 7376]|uniref:hypothetical protein n=1 Tax=[Leptolyngbya] sp. PCC 7376 TaxID=111781 RepID=UPI00029F1957|nr:hypothetical protein [[Leptolyngbya] sp. PCC 7376]AFY40124.1 hypothetical protein Lepto7376_3985 [[Leptolyngbya] sp. PCC 7376]